MRFAGERLGHDGLTAGLAVELELEFHVQRTGATSQDELRLKAKVERRTLVSGGTGVILLPQSSSATD